MFLVRFPVRKKIIWWASLLSLLLSGRLAAQSGNPSQAEALWPLIEARLDQRDSDTTRQFIFSLVHDHCGQDYHCLQNTYDYLLTKLESQFKHFAGLAVARKMVELARKQGDIDAEATALGRLTALHQFMGNTRMATFYREQLLTLYERSGNIPKAIQTKAMILEGRVWYLNEAEDVLPEMEKVLSEALDQNLTDIANGLRIRIKYICEEFGFDDQFVEQIEALENIPLSDPLQPSEYNIAFHAASGRADLFLKEKNFATAEQLYQKALRIYQSGEKSHHDTWLVIYALHRLANLEWERRDTSMAKVYLDEAYAIADRSDMHDRLVLNLGRKIEIAEAEQNYADAFRFTKEIMAREAILDSLAQGFDIEKYHMQVDKEQLEAEKARQALELRFKKKQLNSTLAIVVLVALLALGLFIGLYKQRQGKRELTRQHALIRQQAERLQSLDAAKTRFFANVSHELRTPLTLILGPLRTLLRENRLTEKQAGLLRTAVRNGNQLDQLINEILDLGKLEMGKMILDQKPTGLYAFFNRYLPQFESLAKHKKIDFSHELFVSPKMTVLLDREKCRQILYNLLSNAFKFTPAGGRIQAGLSVDNGILRLTVTDTGPGIHPDDLPHLFDRYFQTNRPDHPAEGGTGIGLALCQEYARLFGGRVEVESAPGEGSTFRVAFPVSLTDVPANDPPSTPLDSDQVETPASAASQTPPLISTPLISTPLNERREETAPEKTGPRKPTILVVEDNAELQDYLRLILSQKYEVLTAGNGREALEVLGFTDHRSPITNCRLVLSDLMMPLMDGYQLLERLKSDDATRHLPVVMLTARADARDRLKALRIGVDDYLLKPFEEEELLVRIDNLLRNQAVRMAAVSEAEKPGKAGPALSGADREWLETFETYVQAHLADDHLSVPALAEAFAMSESTLLRQLKRLTGLTPKQYLQEMRLDEARQLLEKGVYRTVTEVAAEVGYGDARSFSRTFKKRFGKLPSDMMPA